MNHLRVVEHLNRHDIPIKRSFFISRTFYARQKNTNDCLLPVRCGWTTSLFAK